MTPEEKIQYVNYGLKLLSIELHKDLLEKVISVIEVVDKKKGQTSIKDILKLKNKVK
jgi:hypothetical protein